MSTVNKGIMVIISGFSGVGKGTLVKGLMAAYPQEYALSISATTRNPRPGEEEGIHYFFKSKEEFESMIQEHALIEYAQYVGNYYGTPKKYVMDQLDAGRNVILEIEMQGAMKVKEQFPETRLLFVTAPDAASIYQRLKGRDTETEEVILKRMARAREESVDMGNYEYLVINDDLDESIERLHEIITNEQNGKQALNEMYLMKSNKDFVDKMQKELIDFSANLK